MTANQVYKKIDRNFEKFGFNGVLERIRKAHGLKIIVSDESADGDGRHSHAMVLFGYDNSDENVVSAYKNFEEARLDVIYLLKLFDMGLEFECTGDGDGCILMSYRIV